MLLIEELEFKCLTFLAGYQFTLDLFVENFEFSFFTVPLVVVTSIKGVLCIAARDVDLNLVVAGDTMILGNLPFDLVAVTRRLAFDCLEFDITRIWAWRCRRN